MNNNPFIVVIITLIIAIVFVAIANTQANVIYTQGIHMPQYPNVRYLP